MIFLHNPTTSDVTSSGVPRASQITAHDGTLASAAKTAELAKIEMM